MTVAALFVQYGGVYYGIPDVIPYGIGGRRGTYANRDAMEYAGPWPVAAHPTCNRWCQLAPANESRYGLAVGDDGGVFEKALDSVRTYGGVLEHPARSLAWDAFGLRKPDGSAWEQGGGPAWPGGFDFVAAVAQRNYGHPATKWTWLYCVTWSPPPSLIDGPGEPPEAWISTDRPRAELAARGIRQLSKREASRTPIAFRDEVMLAIARSARPMSKRCCKYPNGWTKRFGPEWAPMMPELFAALRDNGIDPVSGHEEKCKTKGEDGEEEGDR